MLRNVRTADGANEGPPPLSAPHEVCDLAEPSAVAARGILVLVCLLRDLLVVVATLVLEIKPLGPTAILARMTLLLLLQRELRAVAVHALSASRIEEDDLVDRMTAAVLSSGAQVFRLVEPSTLTQVIAALCESAPATPDPLSDDIATLIQNQRVDRLQPLLEPFHLRLTLKLLFALRPDVAAAARKYLVKHPDLARGADANRLCQLIEESLASHDVELVDALRREIASHG